MNYNFIETSNVIEAIAKAKNITLDELNLKYDFIVKDEVFLNFKEKILKNRDKKFLIIGDYDCDGICATAIIKKMLMFLNIKSNFYIPSRLKDGYGLNDEVVKMAKDNGFDVLLLVDNGIVCNSQIDLANSLGLKVFIIDHHEYQNLPNAECIIHSNIVNTQYRNLSAGGLAFILSKHFYNDSLSLALGGLATLSDMMNVLGFNRFLIKEMLNVLNSKKLYQFNLLNDDDVFAYESLSFNVIPKINAISRMEPMGNPNHLVEYLLASRESCVEEIERINYINEKRKILTKQMSNEAKALINEEDDIIVVASNNFQEGLCGLIANKIMFDYEKPAICLALTDGYYNGSGRSTNGFNIYNALKNFNHFETYGGHESAVGLSFKEEYYDEFISLINKIKVPIDACTYDAYLIDEKLINNNLVNEINKLKPFGTGFKEPLIAIKNNDYKKTIISSRFPKYSIRYDFSAISFNESLKNKKGNFFIGHIKRDSYHVGGVQLLIEDLI